ncbi:PLP-dependent aminotransferase family protein [Parapedobacter sp. GCM10030251]|uniref:aminotransferase-like domain-containing protein n=1 Tax=Parapedobacter sp. GCM10030251 TaxID=3273419 RepID=UPI00361DFE84
MKNKDISHFTYVRIARVIEQQILNGTLRTGDKLPSLRTICREYGVSQNTALSAYYYLENKLLITPRPQSGYYVCYSRTRIPAIPDASNPSAVPNYGDTKFLVRSVQNTMSDTELLPLSLSAPVNELLPIAKLNKGLIQASRDLKGSGVAYDRVEGNERLRRQIARWAFAMECNLSYQDIIITGGCLNALSFCLMATTQKGNTIAMESPVSYGMLQLAQALGVKVLELPTHPVTGVDLNALEEAMKTGRINACLLVANFGNPLGSCMPDENKRIAVQLAEKYNIPLIENDLNGDVYFGQQRPKSCKTYDESGIVLWCGSVSKTLAPGYRVGWTAPGKFKDRVQNIKIAHCLASTSITQEVIAGFLETGRYENHLRKLRHVLHGNALKYAGVVANHFPEGTMATRPQGGFVLWVELPVGIDTAELYKSAIARRLSFAPGRIFTLQNQYNNCMRLNYGLTWNDTLQSQLIALGNLAKTKVRSLGIPV